MPKDYRNILAAATRSGEMIPKPASASVGSTIHDRVLFSFELYDKKRECISSWEKDEARQLLDMLRKASLMSWMEVLKTGGRPGNKVGLGYTDFGERDPIIRPATLSNDMTISEMRVTDKARVFGCKKGAIYFVIELDRNHKNA